MFRFLFAAFALFWMASLFFGADGAAAGVGLLLLAPIFFAFKLLFFFALAGFMFRAFGGRGRGSRRSWDSWNMPQGPRRAPWSRQADRQSDQRSSKEQFEEWHDLAHARREVDSWTTYEL